MKTKHIKKRGQKYSHLKHALEPRILFDASLGVNPHDLGISADTSSHNTAQTTSQSQDTATNGSTSADTNVTEPVTVNNQTTKDTSPQPVQPPVL